MGNCKSSSGVHDNTKVPTASTVSVAGSVNSTRSRRSATLMRKSSARSSTEFSANDQEKPTQLLEILREDTSLCKSDRREFVKLVIEHSSEYPWRIRKAIEREAKESEDPDDFYKKVFAATKDLFLFHLNLEEKQQEQDKQEQQEKPLEDQSESSRSEENESGTVATTDETASTTQTDKNDQEPIISQSRPQKRRWDGLERNIDTEDEVELVIRTFPHILRQELPDRQGRLRRPIYWLTNSVKAVPFVPLLAELGHELKMFPDIELGGLIQFCTPTVTPGVFETNKYFVMQQLLQDPIAEDEEFGRRGTLTFQRQFDDQTLGVLCRLKKNGFLTKKCVYDTVESILLGKVPCTEKRFRFLLEANPEVMEDKPLMQKFLLHLYNTNKKHRGTTADLKRFETLFDVGLSEYPEEIGFAFHQSHPGIPGCSGEHSSVYAMACKVFRKSVVIEMLDRVIFKSTLGRKDYLQNFVVSACTNDEIMLDGLNFFIRREPATVGIPSFSTYLKQIRRRSSEFSSNRYGYS